MKLSILTFIVACSTQPRPGSDVVFVCEHGAAKSVVAMAYFNQLAAERGLSARAVARGADPQDAPSAATLAGLHGDGLDPGTAPPRRLTDADIRGSARVIAFDCEQPAMRALKGIAACWNDVPAVGGDYPHARDLIRAHVAEVVDQLSR